MGPNSKPAIKPGLWYITIANKNSISALKYKVGWMLFEDIDKTQTNTSLYGSSRERTVDEEGDEWEVVDYTPATSSADPKGKGKGKNMMTLNTLEDALEPPPAYFPSSGIVPGPSDPLTQASDLLSVDERRLRSELAMRGLRAEYPTKREICAALWPHLPPSNGSGAAAGAPALQAGSASSAVASMAPTQSAAVPTAPMHASDEEDEDTTRTPADVSELDFDEPVPHVYLCPITCEIMGDPVVCADGFSYDRVAIQRWLTTSSMSPMTGLKLSNNSVTPNMALKDVIAAWVASHKKK